jgi:CO/xanthine dehydrogenase FAD-binding subunit
MKAAAFDHVAPRSLGEALALLRAHGEDAKLLAGGQSLMPVLALRLAAPAMLVDLNHVAGLDTLHEESCGDLLTGAMLRTRTLELSGRIARAPGSRMCRSATAAPSAAAWPTPTLPPSCLR